MKKFTSKRKPMTVEAYQSAAHKTACYGLNPYYPVMGLCEEVGEFQGKMAKFIRKHHGMEPYVESQSDTYRVALERSLKNDRLPPMKQDPYVAPAHLLKEVYRDSVAFREDARKELGDVCWMVAEVCSAFGWSLEDIMQENLEKLSDRQKRGVIVGEGDNR